MLWHPEGSNCGEPSNLGKKGKKEGQQHSGQVEVVQFTRVKHNQAQPVITALGRQQREDGNFESSLDCIMRRCFKKGIRG